MSSRTRKKTKTSHISVVYNYTTIHVVLRELGGEIAMVSGDYDTIAQLRLLHPSIYKSIDNDRR
jgi:hypothetical protein